MENNHNSSHNPVLVFAERYKAFFDSTNDAIAVFAPEGEILDANPRFAEISGYSFDYLVSKRFDEIFETELIKNKDKNFKWLVTHGFNKEPTEAVLQNRAGQKRYLDISFSLLKNQYGLSETIMAVMRDVTRRKEIEKALINQAEELQKVFDAVPTLLFVIDDRFLIRRINRSGLDTLEKQLNEVLGKSIGEALLCQNGKACKSEEENSKCGRCGILQSMKKCLCDGETVLGWEESLNCLLKGEEVRYFKMNCIPLENRGKRWSVVSLEDITDRKISEKEAVKLNSSISKANWELKRTLDNLAKSQSQLMLSQKLEQIGLLASGLAHNLKTPLAGIKGYAQLLQSENPHLEDLAYINDEVTIMESIITNLMVKSRKDHLKEEEVINLNDLLKIELKFLNSNMFYKHRIEKQIELDESMPSIVGVYSHFSQSILNLIQNALDSMFESETKKLIIRTEHDDKNVYVHIIDTGCGIPESIADKVFDAFFSTKPNASDVNTDSPHGTGLGLGSANQLIRQYGGRIELKSKEMQGTHAMVIIPHQVSSAKSETVRVLISDDSDTIVDLVSRVSSEMGMEVHSALDGESAWDIYRKVRPHIIITDLLMPGLTGPELMSKIRRIQPFQKVIYISGYLENPDFKEWLESESKHSKQVCVLKKPFALDQLQNVLQRFAQDIVSE